MADNTKPIALIVEDDENLANAFAYALDKYENTPIHIAARYDNLDMAFLLYENEADLSAENADGETPEMVAENNNQHKTHAFLKDPEKYRVFIYYEFGKYKELLKSIKTDPDFIKNTDYSGLTVLHLALN